MFIDLRRGGRGKRTVDLHHILMVIGFLLAAYSVVANDAIQTLGTFLSSNANRPWWLLWLYAGGILTVVFLYGWAANDGDVSYGRLVNFPMPETFTWALILPPFVVLVLTRFAIPVSTTFLILTSFTAAALPSMLTKSLIGYALAFVVAIMIYATVSRIFYRRVLDTADQPPAGYWVALQWLSTGFLWSQWLIQDLANIFAYLPRQMDLHWLLFALAVMLGLHAYLFYRRGGAIQGIVTSKTNTQDIRSATIIDIVFALILVFFKELSNVPMSTTWVFLGLLAGREFALILALKIGTVSGTTKVVLSDIMKAVIGLVVSVVIAMTMPYLGDWIGGGPHVTTSAGSAVLSNIDGGTIRIQGARLDLTYAQLANEDISTPANAMAALTQWEQSITDVEDALGSFGADLRALELQTTFLEGVEHAIAEGLGNVVDADMARESTRLTAAQVQQQLAIQTLSLANQRPEAALALFQ